MNESVPVEDGPQSPVDGATQQTAGAAGSTVDPAAPDDAPERVGTVENDGQLHAATNTGQAHVLRPLAIYTLLRFALIVALTLLLMLFMPLIVALLFAIIVQLPLSWLVFAGPRRRLNDAMAQSSAKRRSERAKLQSALSGDESRTDR